jgi:hypothetical protein
MSVDGACCLTLPASLTSEGYEAQRRRSRSRLVSLPETRTRCFADERPFLLDE